MSTEKIRILIAGDLCPYDRVSELLCKSDYDRLSHGTKGIISTADYSLVNLECPIVAEEATPIRKSGPVLSTSPKVVELIKSFGFKGVTLANNHILDQGEKGVSTTIAECTNAGIDVVGGGMSQTEASQTLLKEVCGVKIAFINACEHEFNIATSSSAGANPLNPIQQYYAIQQARQDGAQRVIVIIHGGVEHYNKPTPRMKETYRFFIDAGADAVINHHQHCYSGYEVYKGKPIFYGLGNFCFDDPDFRNNIWNYGYLAFLTFTNCNVNFQIIPYEQGNVAEPSTTILDVIDRKRVEDDIEEINRAIENDDRLKVEYENFMDANDQFLRFCLKAYIPNRVLRVLDRLGLLSDVLSGERLYHTLNNYQCESHRERVIHFLKKKCALL